MSFEEKRAHSILFLHSVYIEHAPQERRDRSNSISSTRGCRLLLCIAAKTDDSTKSQQPSPMLSENSPCSNECGFLRRECISCIGLARALTLPASTRGNGGGKKGDKKKKIFYLQVNSQAKNESLKKDDKDWTNKLEQEEKEVAEAEN